MGYEYDVILSYTKSDDQPIKAGDGWVTNFHKFLSTLLDQISRSTTKFNLISDDGSISPEEFLKAPVLVNVLTPEFVRSDKLVKGAEHFCKEADKKEGIEINGVPRLFKVVKTPGNFENFLPEYEKLVTYDFFQIDPETGEGQEFQNFFGPDAERSYWMKLVDMAYDINHLLTLLDEKKAKTDEEKKLKKDKTIYLASTGVDMVIQRDMIKRELIRHGYTVYPQHSLPREGKSLEAMVKKDLKECQLSIHMIGEDYGYRPRGSELSTVDIQNKVADEYTDSIVKKNKEVKAEDRQTFSRLIWITPDLKNVTERQKIFIEDLKSEAALLDEAEVLQVSLQEFKKIIRDELTTGGRYKLARVMDENEERGAKRESKNLIYLICNKDDVKLTEPLSKYLEKEGYEVMVSGYKGDLVDLRYLHQENLRRCDASIIYYGSANYEWIRSKIQDVMKAPGFGRRKPIKAKAIYVEGDKVIDSAYQDQAMVITTNNGFDPQSLKPFLAKLKES